MKVKIDSTIVKAIEHVMNDCPTKYECRIIKLNNAIWYEFWHENYRDFFVEVIPYSICVVFKKSNYAVQSIARDVAMILHGKLIDPNDIAIPV
jgi:acyl carrier protein phosphodiesterase